MAGLKPLSPETLYRCCDSEKLTFESTDDLEDLDELLGQDHLVGEGKPLRNAIETGEVTSMVFWGPPGSGKTTLARIIARHTERHFEPFSAVTMSLICLISRAIRSASAAPGLLMAALAMNR